VNFDILAVAVAEHLAGRPVTYSCREQDSERLGKTFRHGDLAVIEVAPTLTADQWLNVFLHEVAHCKHHFERLQDQAVEASDKKPDMLAKVALELSSGLMELEATFQAHKWKNYANSRTKERTAAARLVELLDY